MSNKIICSIPNVTTFTHEEQWYLSYFSQDYWDLVEFSCASLDVTEREVAFLIEQLRSINAETVVDIGCGIGRHARGLTEANFEWWGVDVDADAISLARAEIAQANRVIESDMRTFQLPKCVDAALLMQTTFGYFSDEENKHLLRTIHHQLNHHGLIVIDVPNRDQMLKHFSVRDWTSVFNKYYAISHQFDYLQSRRNTTMKVIDDGIEREYYHSIRMYTLAELCTLLNETGFEPVRLYGDFVEGNIRYDQTFRRLQVVAQKR